MTDLNGRTFLVSGANTGIGKETARELARRRARVWLAGRSEERTRAAMAEITETTGSDNLAFLPLDLGSLASVRTAAETYLATGEPLHVLINNAGIAGARGLTEDGFEIAFGTNHVGTFLFTRLLTDRIVESGPDARIINVASGAHKQAKGIDWDAVRQPTSHASGWPEYTVSKLANVLHMAELGRRLAGSGVTTYSVHPGGVASDVWREVPWGARHLIKLFLKSTAEGARTSLYCATSPEAADQTGRYWDRQRAARPGKAATPGLAAELWERSEAWTA